MQGFSSGLLSGFDSYVTSAIDTINGNIVGGFTGTASGNYSTSLSTTGSTSGWVQASSRQAAANITSSSAGGSTVNVSQSFDTKIVRADEDLYVASRIINNSAKSLAMGWS